MTNIKKIDKNYETFCTDCKYINQCKKDCKANSNIENSINVEDMLLNCKQCSFNDIINNVLDNLYGIDGIDLGNKEDFVELLNFEINEICQNHNIDVH